MRLLCLLGVVASVVMALSGAALASCNGSYCNNVITNCSPTAEVDLLPCCEDFDGDGIFHCVTCSCRLYFCPNGGGIPSYVFGPPYNCGAAGVVCQ